MNHPSINPEDFKIDKTGRVILRNSVVALTEEVNDFVAKVMDWKKDSLLLGQLTEILSDAFVQVNKDGLVVAFNAAACRLFGTSAEYMLGKSISILFLDDWKTLSTRNTPYFVHQVKTLSGDVVTVSTSVSTSVTVCENESIFLVRDISRDLQHEADIRILSQALDATSDSIMVTNRENKILFVNGAFSRHTGYNKEEALGRDPSFLGTTLNPKSTYEDMWNALSKRKAWSGVILNQHKEGHLLEDYTVITPILNRDPDRPSYYIAVKRHVENN